MQTASLWENLNVTEMTITADFISMCDYKGFDPEATMTVLITKMKDAGITPPVFMTDMFHVVLIYCKRGTSWGTEKFKNKSMDKLKDEIVRLQGRYDIKNNLAGNSSKEVITVARIVLCFTEMAAFCYGCGLASPIVGNEVPVWASFPGGCSLMTDDEWKTHEKNYRILMVKFTKTINRGKEEYKNKTDKEIEELQEVYIQSSRNSPWAKKLLTKKRAAVTNMWVKFGVDLKNAGKAVDVPSFPQTLA